MLDLHHQLWRWSIRHKSCTDSEHVSQDLSKAWGAQGLLLKDSEDLLLWDIKFAFLDLVLFVVMKSYASRAETNEADRGVSCRDVSGRWVSCRWTAVGRASPLGSAMTLLCVTTSTITWIETGLFKWAVIGISLWYFTLCLFYATAKTWMNGWDSWLGHQDL